MNGHLAVQTVADPTPATLARWAPFTFGLPGTVGANLHFGEDLAMVRSVVPATALVIGFRWDFGDGHTARGLRVGHRFRHPGWYRVTVLGRWPSIRSWVAFDSAQVHIVPASS